MRASRAALLIAALFLVIGTPAMPASAQPGGDVLVSNGSPSGPFAANKQNEPAVAVDAHAPNVLAAGSNDEIDVELCAAGDPTTCPFTDGVGRRTETLTARWVLSRRASPASHGGVTRGFGPVAGSR